MLSQQTGRYLFKTFRTLLANPDAPMSVENKTAGYILKYISNPQAKATAQFAGDFKDTAFFVQAFGHRAAYLTATALRKRDIERRTWNSLLIDIFRCSVAHSQFVLVSNFANAMEHDAELKAQPAVHNVMKLCFELFATYTMDQEASEFLSSGYLSPRQAELIRDRVRSLSPSSRAGLTLVVARTPRRAPSSGRAARRRVGHPRLPAQLGPRSLRRKRLPQPHGFRAGRAAQRDPLQRERARERDRGRTRAPGQAVIPHRSL